jgi:glyoxylase-like metal-dependent hydrolase (beta-lactamase superfamily II)
MNEPASIARIPLPVETRAPGGETNAYVVGETQGVLVDPAARSPALDRAADARTVSDVLVTHAHPDHVGSVAAYAARTDATVWAHENYRECFARATGVEPDRTFADGTSIGSADSEVTVTVLETPGHAPDHVALATEAGILVGDLAVASGSVAITAGEGHLASYLDSLRRLRERSPRRLFPAHGPVIDDPEGTLTRLIDRRAERERRIREAITGGARDLAAITDAAYEKDVSGVRDLAEGTVAAHVEKLAAEGAVTWDGERATPT